MNKYLLHTQGVTKSYGTHKVVNNIDIHIKKGAIYGFIGRNGAGKTTFMKMICGLAKPTSGDIFLFDKSGLELNQIRDRIGCLIEAPGLYPDMSAYDNLKLKCIAKNMNKKSYINELLELVGLQDTNKKNTSHFSLGMKQRLGIALALVGEPDLLVLDEPINGLDPQGIIEIRETLLKLNKERNITIMISSHILDELSKLATDYGIIHNGELIEEITAFELESRCSRRIEITMNNPKTAIPTIDALGINNYSVVDGHHIHIYERIDDSSTIITELVKSGCCLSEIKVYHQNLEDYYIELTGGAKND